MRNRERRIGIALLALVLVAGIGAAARAQDPAGVVSLEQILKELAAWDGGIDSEPLWKLRNYVQARKDSAEGRKECEAALLAFLSTRATRVARMAVCRQLRLIGSDASVPVLQAMILDPGTADMAMYALEKIPGPAADRALLQALSKTEGGTKTAVIAALGDRRCPEAVPALSPLLKPDNPMAGAAALALGEIATEPAAVALVAAYSEIPLTINLNTSSVRRPGDAPAALAVTDIRPLFAAAIMKCAEARIAAKNASGAAALYDRLLADPALPVAIRKGAMIGRIGAAGERAQAMLIDQLKGADAGMQEAAIAAIRNVVKPDDIGQICSLLPGLTPDTQVKLLAVLPGYPADRVRPAVMQAAQSDAMAVRLAALKAVGVVGDASSVPFLAEWAAASRGAEQTAARAALGLLKGRQVDAAVLSGVTGHPRAEVQAELLQAIGDRRMFAAKGVVVERLGFSSARIRVQALRTLRVIGTPSDMPAVLAALIESGEDTERLEAETTVSALAQTIANPDGRAAAVKGMLAETKDPQALARLYGVLGRIGDDTSLPQLRIALAHDSREIVDVAVRALAAWPTPAARDDLLLLARKSENESHRLLALQGLVRMIGSERNRKPEGVVADLKQASLLAARPEEKKLILGLLPRFGCPEALQLAESFAGDAALKAETQAAINKLKAQLSRK